MSDIRKLTPTDVVTVIGDSASGQADSGGDPVKAGGVYHATPPTFSDGNRGDIQLDANGNLKMIIVGTTLPSTYLPSVDATYDLGSASYRWRDLYLSRNLILSGAPGIIAPAANSVTALQITKADKSTVIMDVDTSNARVGFGGNVAPAQAVDVTGSVKASASFIGPKILPASDSTTAVEITASNGTTVVMDVDTTNGRIGLGNAAPEATLDVTGNFVTDPSALAASGGAAMDCSKANVFTITPTASETINASNFVAGQLVDIIVLTSGTNSYTLTFGTGFKYASATLATGAVSGKYFLIHYVSDGNYLIELARTAAI
jgi:hypothetical protein